MFQDPPRDAPEVEVRPPPAAPGLAAGSPPTRPTPEYPATRESGVQAAGRTGPTKELELADPPEALCHTETSFAAAATTAA